MRGATHMTGNIQLALNDSARANTLRALLSRSAGIPVICVDCPVMEDACVVVVDPPHLTRLPAPLPHPERVVLISRGDAGTLKYAWDAGVSSVISEEDPLNTAVLAILAACLRAGSCRQKHAGQTAPPREDDALVDNKEMD